MSPPQSQANHAPADCVWIKELEKKIFLEPVLLPGEAMCLWDKHSAAKMQKQWLTARWTSAGHNWPNGKAVFSHRYEVEINRRTAAENEFVVLKKVRVGGVGRRFEHFQSYVTVMCIG